MVCVSKFWRNVEETAEEKGSRIGRHLRRQVRPPVGAPR